MHLKSGHVELVKRLQAELRKVKDLSRITNRIANVQATVQDWLALAQSISSMNVVRGVWAAPPLVSLTTCDRQGKTVVSSMVQVIREEYVQESAPIAATDVLTDVLATCSSQLQWVQAMLHEVVDWDASKVASRLVICPGKSAATTDAHRGLNQRRTLVGLAQA